MSEFKLSDPFGSAPSAAPFTQSVSTGVPWHNLPITREYTLGQLLVQGKFERQFHAKRPKKPEDASRASL